MTDNIDELLKAPQSGIDFLPQQVKLEDNLSFFEQVEQYYLSKKQSKELAVKFTNILLKVLCYYKFTLYFNNEKLEENASLLTKKVQQILSKQKGDLLVFIEDEEVLLQLSGGQLTLAVYNCGAEMEKLLKELALAEGLFYFPPR